MNLHEEKENMTETPSHTAYLNVAGWAGLLRKERKDGDYHKIVFQIVRGGKERMEEVGSDGGRWVYGTIGVPWEMVYGLSVAESSGGNDGSTALCCARSYRR